MPKTIYIELSDASIGEAIKELRRYKAWVEKKESELREKLAQLGADIASIKFSQATYDGTNDVSVRVENGGKSAIIYAEGQSVAFIEFGSGATYGYGHPLAGQFDVGPGTYSEGPEGKGHWENPKGWFYAHDKRSLGNPPAMAMVRAVEEMTKELTKIAREVFRA
jgi:hypothetical protein